MASETEIQIHGRDATSLSRRAGLSMSLVLLLAAAGCGASQDANHLPVYRTTGQISINAEIPRGATIVLHPKQASGAEAVRPRGEVLGDGTFSLTSYETNDGAPEGDYKVTIDWRKIVRYPNGDAGPGPNLAPKEYTRPESSPLSVQIVAGSNRLKPIVLKQDRGERQAAAARGSAKVAGGMSRASF